MLHQTNRQLAAVLARSLSDDTLARVMNDLLCVEAEPKLSDADVAVAARLFDNLTELRPDVIELAQSL